MLSVFSRFALNLLTASYSVINNEKMLLSEIQKQTYISHESFQCMDSSSQFIVRHNSKTATSSLSQRGAPFISVQKAHSMKIAPQISAAITSDVRLMLHDIIKDKSNNALCYGDTDSVFVKKELDP